MKELVTNTDPNRSRKEFYEELLEQIKCICEDQTFWVDTFCTKFHETNKINLFSTR